MNPGSETLSIALRRTSPNQPWGFRLQGGIDFTTPLSVQSVNNSSVAENCGLMPGDAVLSINNVSADELEHEAAKRLIMMAGDEVQLVIQRGAVKIWKPNVTPMSDLRPTEVSHVGPDGQPQYVQKTSLAAEKQDVMHIGSSHNRTARPFPGFGGGSSGASSASSYSQPPPPQQPYQQQQQQPEQQQPAYGAPPQSAIVNAQYNTPINMYSNDNLADTYTQQAQALTGGVANYSPNQYGQPGAAPSGGMGYSAAAGASPSRVAGTRSVQAPVSKPPSERKDAQYMRCKVCGSLCVGVFVKIRGEPMHPECFKCTKCSRSLKQQGYIVVEEQLYCEPCAKQVAVPPSDNMVPSAVYR